MNKYDVIEMSKIYKRLLEVEITLKERLIFALKSTYPNHYFNRLLPYLINELSHNKYLSGKDKNKRDKINDLINSNKTQEDKLLKFLNMAYLSDILGLLVKYKKLRKDKLFKKNFYNNIPNQNLVEKHSSNLNNLRNSIMHFNFTKYSNNKIDYLNSLGFWERLLYCPNYFLHTLPKIEPKVSTILKLLSEACADFYEMDDRLICDMFDDLAFINGKKVNELPQLWTIGRELYRLKRNKNNT